MRARMALWVAEISVDHREVVLRDKPPAMLEISPKGTVPVLALLDGSVLEESIDIMRWALAQNDPEGWLVGDDQELIAMIDGPFKHHLDRYKYGTRHDSDSPERQAIHQAEGLAILRRLDERLTNSAFLCGRRRTMADIATFPFIRQFANTDRDWFNAQDLRALQNWLAGLLASELFAAIMVKREQWVAA